MTDTERDFFLAKLSAAGLTWCQVGYISLIEEGCDAQYFVWF